MFDVITVGSSTVDVFIHTDPKQTELLKVHKHLDVAYPLGAKILIKELEFFTGGGGTNTAVAFSRLGLKTGWIGRVGSDDNGRFILEEIEKEGVTFLGYVGGKSGYSVVLDAIESDRTIFTYKGCNNDLSYRKIKSLNTKWFYLSSMMEKSFNTLKKISYYANIHDKKIAFNPSLYLAKRGFKFLKPILRNTEIIILNKEEAQALLNLKNDNEYYLLYELYKKGPKIIVITDGKNGVFCFDSYEKTFYSVKPLKIKVKETTGAGDAFASGFVAAKIQGKNTEYSLRLGMLNAESVIKHKGAKNNLLGKEAYKLVEKDKRSIAKYKNEKT
ncbi:MAG: carbohydrate kinase family protein [Candidatus Woesearchaeota archaeon]